MLNFLNSLNDLFTVNVGVWWERFYPDYICLLYNGPYHEASTESMNSREGTAKCVPLCFWLFASAFGCWADGPYPVLSIGRIVYRRGPV